MPPNKIVVVGPGIVGMPMAALLATSRSTDGSSPPRVVVVQRNSATSGWKVDAINSGRSPLGDVEPHLARAVADGVASGRLSATHDAGTSSDADAILVCVPTDKAGLAPDLAPLQDALRGVACALRGRPVATRPLVIIESTLAPSTMQSVVAPLFAEHGLRDGQEVLLGNSPSRVRPRAALTLLAGSDRIAAGLHPETPGTVAALYRRILSGGRVLVTNSLTAELVTTMENAYRDVRIAFSAEVARYCDRVDVDFFTLRDQVNDILGSSDGASWDASIVPTGAMLVPTVGVGGPCLPKDGVLLWWRALEAGFPSRNSLILAARAVNDASPAATVRLARIELGPLNGRKVAVLGAAYHADSDDTRYSPGLVLAALLRDSGADVRLHDPHVAPHDANLARFGLDAHFTADLELALDARSAVFVTTAHGAYRELGPRLRQAASGIEGVIDACNLFHALDFSRTDLVYAGIGRGRRAPDSRLVHSVAAMHRAVARGVSNEVVQLAGFLNDRYAPHICDRINVDDARRLAATSALGCDLCEPGDIDVVEPVDGFISGLAQLAVDAAASGQRTPRVLPESVPPGLWFGNEDARVSETDTPWPLTPNQ
ncbi:MAG TPA: nucleotide sugar dehydrogenase [Gemmatimonadaceae bacterium]